MVNSLNTQWTVRHSKLGLTLWMTLCWLNADLLGCAYHVTQSARVYCLHMQYTMRQSAWTNSLMHNAQIIVMQLAMANCSHIHCTMWHSQLGVILWTHTAQWDISRVIFLNAQCTMTFSQLGWNHSLNTQCTMRHLWLTLLMHNETQSPRVNCMKPPCWLNADLKGNFEHNLARSYTYKVRSS